MINHRWVLVMNLIECRRGVSIILLQLRCLLGTEESTKAEEHALALRQPKTNGTQQNQQPTKHQAQDTRKDEILFVPKLEDGEQTTAEVRCFTLSCFPHTIAQEKSTHTGGVASRDTMRRLEVRRH
jgi:hypothetical protein